MEIKPFANPPSSTKARSTTSNGQLESREVRGEYGIDFQSSDAVAISYRINRLFRV